MRPHDSGGSSTSESANNNGWVVAAPQRNGSIGPHPARARRAGAVTTFSLVIPTRDRPEHIVDCLAAALLPDPDLVEVIVVDQSDTDASETKLAEHITDVRLKVVRTSTRGVSAGRNIGFEIARGDIILCTDDDCRVPADWIASYREVFAADPDVDVVYSTVTLPEGTPSSDFAATFHPTPEVYRGRLPRPHDPWGISANMAIRRTCLERVAPFDEALGAGGRFGSGAETDFTVRVVAAGGVVAHVDGPPMIHLGFRTGSEASRLVRRYGNGLGAVGMKHVRLRSRPGGLFLVRFIVAHGRRALWNIIRRRQPSGAGLTIALFRGAVASARVPIDHERGVYVSPPAPDTGTEHVESAGAP